MTDKTPEEVIALAKQCGAIVQHQVAGGKIVFFREEAELQAFAAALTASQSVQPVGIWTAKTYSDVPDGLTEVYPENGPCQFLAPRGDGSIKGNEVWMITLPHLPNEQSTARAQPVQPAESVGVTVALQTIRAAIAQPVQLAVDKRKFDYWLDDVTRHRDSTMPTPWQAWQAAIKSTIAQPEQPAAFQSIKIPTDTMEQEFATHERRGYAKGFAAALAQPVQPAPRGTDAQILKERELTASAIEGAMAYGYQNWQYPPDDAAWLRPFWEMGRRDAEREAIAQPVQPKETE